jgi:DNA repair photolyase
MGGLRLQEVVATTDAETRSMIVYETKLKGGITRTKEFERKKLASFAVNVGTKCGHACSYCSTGALLRMHRSFADIGRSSFEDGFAVIDPATPERVALDARRIRGRGMIQLCTTVDAWAPEAQEHDLGRRCLEAILREAGWTVRILTKNAAVSRDFDLIEQYKDRVLVGLSITATERKAAVIAAVEPNASPIHMRFAALREAHTRGLRTYAMLCPLLPGTADSADEIDALITAASEFGAEEIFVEPVNARGPGLRKTQDTLWEHGYRAEAAAIAEIRRADRWSRYAANLIRTVQESVRRHLSIDRLRVLLYPSRLDPADVKRLREDEAGIVWLGKD